MRELTQQEINDFFVIALVLYGHVDLNDRNCAVTPIIISYRALRKEVLGEEFGTALQDNHPVAFKQYMAWCEKQGRTHA